MTHLLIDEPPLQVLPSLAEEIGLNEAIVLQQLHYWTNRSDNVEKDEGGAERRWVYKSYSEWEEEFSFWSRSTIRRTITSLREDDLVIAEQKKKTGGDGRMWYAIQYESLDGDEQGGLVNMNKGGVQSEQGGLVNMNSSAHAHNAGTRSETTTETTTENNHTAHAREGGGSLSEKKKNQVEELTRRGVGESAACHLVQNFDWTDIFYQIRHYEHLKQKGRCPESPGWIVSAVKDGYDLPRPVRKAAS